MGVAQSSIMKLTGSITGAALAAAKLKEGFGEESGQKLSKVPEASGVDAKMAIKARKTAQMKIKTIQANKEISDKAKSRRIGKVLDEYMGGNK